MTAPQRLAQALQDARSADGDQHSVQATVTAVQAATVTVSINGVESTWPFIANSYSPRVGDVVWCVGPPGSWVVIGTVSGQRQGNFNGGVNAGGLSTSTSYVATAEDGGASFRGPSGTFGGQTINGGGFAGSKYVATADAPGFFGPSASFGGVVINGGGIGAAGKNISTDPNGSMNSLQITCGNLTYGTLTQGSDSRLKDVVEDAERIDAAADQLLGAPVRSWSWREKRVWDAENESWVDVTPDHGQHLGIVAQDAPAPLQVTRDDGYLALDRATYDGLLLRIVQRQDTRIAELEARVAMLMGAGDD